MPAAAKSADLADVARELAAIQAGTADLARRVDTVAALVRDALQTGGVGGPGPMPRRPRAPRKRPLPPTPVEMADRQELWSAYVNLAFHANPPAALSKTRFADRHRLSTFEFCRWLNSNDRRGIPTGSVPDLSYKRTLEQAIDKLKAAAAHAPMPNGTGESYQHALRPPTVVLESEI